MLHSDKAILVVIDVQSRLLPQIADAERTVGQIVKLIHGFRIVKAPILLTEQYRKGLGETDGRIRDAVRGADPWTGLDHDFEPMEKMSFSCMLDPSFRAALEASGRRQVVLCGIEAHVCVHQTALHLIEQGYRVEIAADAVSSRSAENREIALHRMEGEGARWTCVETAIFEMLERCGTDAFKHWVRMIR